MTKQESENLREALLMRGRSESICCMGNAVYLVNKVGKAITGAFAPKAMLAWIMAR